MRPRSTPKIVGVCAVGLVVGLAGYVTAVLFSADYSRVIDRVEQVLDEVTEAVRSADFLVRVPRSGPIVLRPSAEPHSSEIIGTVEELKNRIVKMPKNTRVVVFLDERALADGPGRSSERVRALLAANTSQRLFFIHEVPEGLASE